MKPIYPKRRPKKAKAVSNIPKQSTLAASLPQEISDSEDEGGFSKWLRSEEGTDLLKLFVLGNTIIVFLMMAWPSISAAFASAFNILNGEDLH